MNYFFFLILTLISFCGHFGPMPALAAAPLVLPAVTQVHGKTWLHISGKPPEALKAKTLIRENSILETTLHSDLQLDLRDHEHLYLRENTKVEVPAITWETLEFSYLNLKFGELIWDAKKDPSQKAPTSLILKNELLYLTLPAEGKYHFLYNPKLAQMEVRVYEGSIEFSQMNAEVTQTVSAGEKIKFQGILSEEGFEYDLLLKGKKIPKGFLTPLEKISTADLKVFTDLFKKPDHQKLKASKTALNTLSGPLICQKPKGVFNDCSWQCEHNPKIKTKKCHIESGARCVKYRCNANGLWSDRMVLTGGASLKCQAQPQVEACDY